MPDLKNLYSHSAIILPVRDIEKSTSFYRDLLGFDLTFSWGNPVGYVVLKGGDHVSVHLTQHSVDVTSDKEHVSLYVFAHDVDALYEGLIANGVEIHNAIGGRDYGMRDFDIKDPDGHILSFGKGG